MAVSLLVCCSPQIAVTPARRQRPRAGSVRAGAAPVQALSEIQAGAAFARTRLRHAAAAAYPPFEGQVIDALLVLSRRTATASGCRAWRGRRRASSGPQRSDRTVSRHRGTVHPVGISDDDHAGAARIPASASRLRSPERRCVSSRPSRSSWQPCRHPSSRRVRVVGAPREVLGVPASSASCRGSPERQRAPAVPSLLPSPSFWRQAFASSKVWLVTVEAKDRTGTR